MLSGADLLINEEMKILLEVNIPKKVTKLASLKQILLLVKNDRRQIQKSIHRRMILI